VQAAIIQIWRGATMTYEEAFDYIRSISSMKEEQIREALEERMKETGESVLADEDSGTSFQIRFNSADGFTIDAIF